MTTSLVEVPTDRKELLDHYDVIILGDVNPYAISPDPQRCEDFLKGVREFVERHVHLCEASAAAASGEPIMAETWSDVSRMASVRGRSAGVNQRGITLA